LPYYNIDYGNASSIHKLGVRASIAIEKAREIIAKKISCSTDEIYFTSGGTESNNLAIKGLAYANRKNAAKRHIVISSIEHPSVTEACTALEKEGFTIYKLKVDKFGFVDLDDLFEKLSKNNVLLVSIMHANNEIGTIEPIREIGEICKKFNVFFHSDACQSFTKVEIDVNKDNLDLLTLNSHKIHGPKGIGALYVRKGIKLESLMSGGGQERTLRPGTYNTPLIAGFGKAVDIASEEDNKKMYNLRDYFINQILEKFKDNITINGPLGNQRLSNNINVTFHGINAKKLFIALNKYDIFVSTGSACSSTKLKPSDVLLSIGCTPKDSNSSLRISLSKWTSQEELDITLNTIYKIVNELKLIK
jgi:cysteine desulfurase